MSEPFPIPFRIALEQTPGPGGQLSVALRAPNGASIFRHQEALDDCDDEAPQLVLKALMSAMACALREDARTLRIEVAPPDLLSLLVEDAPETADPVSASLQKWTRSQFGQFDQVTLKAMPLKLGIVRLGQGQGEADVTRDWRRFGNA